MADEIEKISKDVEELAKRVGELPKGFGWREVLPVISVIATLALGIYSTTLDSRTRANEHDIATAKQRLEDSAFRIAVLHEVKDAIADKDEKRQEAVAMFVKSLDTSKFQESMANLLARLADSPTAREISVYTADEAQLNLATPSTGNEISFGSPRGWDYDIFWCQYSDQGAANKAKDQADTFYKALLAMQKNQGLGRIRLRPLPTLVNQEPGYNISGYVILRNISKEAQASQLKAWLDAVSPPIQFKIRDSDRKLSWYLSVFICPSTISQG